ncbi:MAG: hypothetical protein RLY14_365 [Planctomycetota bacterium]|jgi:hypothetical protein
MLREKQLGKTYRTLEEWFFERSGAKWKLSKMAFTDVTKRGLAATYLILYVIIFLWALSTKEGAGGGMAFVLPIILGLPWSLLLGLLLLVAPLPKTVMFLLLLVVPPAINVWLILRTSGIFRTARDLNPSITTGKSDSNNKQAEQ